MVEALSRLAPFAEPEVSSAIEGVLVDEGIAVVTGAVVSRVGRDVNGYRLAVADSPDVLRAEQLLVATGRRPATAELNLAAVGVKTGDRGEVVVNEFLRTDNSRVWAAGDVTGNPQFVHVAGRTARSSRTMPSTRRGGRWTTATCRG